MGKKADDVKGPKKIRIKDVALRANVSTATVSRVLNNHPKMNEISIKTRQRVWDVAQDLGYVPNLAGRHLRLGYNFSSLGIFFSKGMLKLSNEPFFWSVVEGIISVVGETYQCLHLDKRFLSKHGDNKILNELVQGVITVDYIDDSLMEAFKDYRGPIVCVFPGRDVFPFAFIEAQDKEGAFSAIKYLSSLGHKRLAFVSGFSGEFERPVFKNRYSHCLEASSCCNIIELRKLYVPNWSVITRDGKPHIEEESFVINSLENVTAIVAANDYIALWLIKVLTSRGIKIPDDINIIGFDNIYLAALSHPALSTVEIPAIEAGLLAANTFLKMVNRESVLFKQYVKTKLIIRDSCCQISKNNSF